MGAGGAVRDFGCPLGETQGESPLRALTEEQQRGQPKDRPPPPSSFHKILDSWLPQTPPRVFVRWLLVYNKLGKQALTIDVWGRTNGRSQFEKRMEARRLAEQGEDPDTELPGWCIGSEAFRKELLAQVSEGKGPEHFGKEMLESAEEKAK